MSKEVWDSRGGTDGSATGTAKAGPVGPMAFDRSGRVVDGPACVVCEGGAQPDLDDGGTEGIATAGAGAGPAAPMALDRSGPVVDGPARVCNGPARAVCDGLAQPDVNDPDGPAPVASVASAPLNGGTDFSLSMGSGDVTRIREGPASGRRSLAFVGAGPVTLHFPPIVSLAFAFPFLPFALSKKFSSPVRCLSKNFSSRVPAFCSSMYSLQHRKRYRFSSNSATNSSLFLTLNISAWCVVVGK